MQDLFEFVKTKEGLALLNKRIDFLYSNEDFYLSLEDSIKNGIKVDLIDTYSLQVIRGLKKQIENNQLLRNK